MGLPRDGMASAGMGSCGQTLLSSVVMSPLVMGPVEDLLTGLGSHFATIDSMQQQGERASCPDLTKILQARTLSCT